jgi:hypothetical protein
MHHRTKKQIVIALIVFMFWGGVIGAGVWATREPPARPTPTPQTFSAPEVASVTVLRTSAGKADVVGLVKNPNADAGARSLRYEFVLSVDGAAVRTIPGETYVLPGRQKYVSALNQDVPPGRVTAELRLKDPQWVAVESGFRAPSIVLVNSSRRTVPGPPPVQEIKGLLANESDVDYLRVEVTVVGVDPKGDVIGIGQSFLGSLRSLERREFTAQWPLPAGAEVANVRVFPDVNVFRADAIQQRQGATEIRDVPRPAGSPAP